MRNILQIQKGHDIVARAIGDENIGERLSWLASGATVVVLSVGNAQGGRHCCW